MSSDRLGRQIAFSTEIDRLKQVVRETCLADGSRRETTAEHSWHIAVMALILSEYSNSKTIDVSRVIRLLLVHDIVEIDAGDTFLYDPEAQLRKKKLEDAAATHLFGLLPEDQREEMMSLWNEFEDQHTDEAKFAKAIDSLQPVLLAYTSKGIEWKRHSLTDSVVMEKKSVIREGSELLWQLTRKLIEDAHQKGYFSVSTVDG